MNLQVIPAAQVAPTPWRNGGGLTRELLVWPPLADEWQLRITLAEVGRDGPFSPFPGVRRHFVVASGNGLSLRWAADGPWQDLRPGHAPLSFDGAQAPDCRLLPAEGSPASSTDLNLMTRGRWQGRMQPMRLLGDDANPSGQTASTTWPAAHRGFFAMRPGRWHRGQAPAQAVGAMTLVWQQQDDAGPKGPAPEAWVFTPDTPPDDGLPCGWWLGAIPLDQD